MTEPLLHGYAVYNHQILEHSKSTNNHIDSINRNDDTPDINPLPIQNDSSESKSHQTYRLSLLSSDIQAEQETTLRSFLTKRFERLHPSEGNSGITSIPAGQLYEQSAMVYFYLMSESDANADNSISNSRDNNTKKGAFLICFVVVVDSGLELFHAELDRYCQALSPYIHKYMESVDVSEYLNRLESWFEINIRFIQRCFSYIDAQLPAVIFSCFLGKNVVFKGLSETAENDLQSFISCCSLSDLLQDKSFKNIDLSVSPKSRAQFPPFESLEIKFEDEIFQVQSSETNVFCEDCVRAMKQVGLENPFKLRQVLENYKLKIIQDMNTFKRLTKQAETDYYSLYRSYSFLLCCDNGEVLLKNAKVQCEDNTDKNCRDIIVVLREFIDGKQGFAGIQKKDKLKTKSQHLLRLLNC